MTIQRNLANDRRLRRVVDAWPELTGKERTAILAIVGAAMKKTKANGGGLSRFALLSRGWTHDLIDHLLGEPDAEGGRGAGLYAQKRVAWAEGAEAFRLGRVDRRGGGRPKKGGKR